MAVKGCQSKNHEHATCYGALWKCRGCGIEVCYQEGADDEHPDLCDTCWEKAQKAQQQQSKGSR